LGAFASATCGPSCGSPADDTLGHNAQFNGVVGTCNQAGEQTKSELLGLGDACVHALALGIVR